MKTFSDAYIRRLNAACDEIKHCQRSCLGMGWCSEVYELELKRRNEGISEHDNGGCLLHDASGVSRRN